MIIKYKEILRRKGELYLRVKIRPGAAKSEIKNVMDDETLKINISAPPVNGKANIELVKFISNEFDVSKNCVKIISGAGERIKLIKVNQEK